MKTIIIAMSLLLSGYEARAQDLTMGTHLVSLHADQDACGIAGGCNFNPGLYVDYKGWTAGFYRNSQRFNSVYAGYTFRWPANSRLNLGLTTGVITGYRKFTPGGVPSTTYTDPQGTVWLIDGVPTEPSWKKVVRLMVVPSASVQLTDKTALRVSLLPKFKRTNPTSTIHFSIESKF